MKPLEPASLPLSGVHLIEASAGTGKTFNITRLYLRMLLHRRLKVTEILVMTFTRAATGELRRRIADELRAALGDWERLTREDAFYRELAQGLPHADGEDPTPQALAALRNALLLLDEAPILTLHGFCKRALTQRAFDSGIAFNVEMGQDTRELALEAVRDAYRRLARSDAVAYTALAARWPTPEDFEQEFGPLIDSREALRGDDPEAVAKAIQARKAQLARQLEQHREQLFAALIDQHKDKARRRDEWQALLDWLKRSAADTPAPPAAACFVHGTRYARKPEIKALLTPVKEFIAANKPDGRYPRRLADAGLSRIAIEQLAWIRAHFENTKQRQRLMDFDDLVAHLAACLREDGGSRLAARLREQYPVALVDEFQDTDPQQYTILHKLYAHRDDTALYMIGDPKQAIYAFRGGDIFTYLQARDHADGQWFMDTNWRSTSAMVAATNRLFARAQAEHSRILGPAIRYQAVAASPRADDECLHDPGQQGALCLVWLTDEEGAHSGRQGIKQTFRADIAAWCASEIDRLLAQARLGARALRAGDIAVLVRDAGEARQIQQALRALGHASVYLSTRDKVFASEEAFELLRALLGILHHDDPRLFNAALASHYFALDSTALHRLQRDDAWYEHWQNRLAALREAWQRRGFIAMAMQLLHDHAQPPPERHERALTNSIHLIELLQQASQQHRQPEQLLGWFQDRIEAGDASQEAELRLESDAELIRVITQHGAKGLEYPVVFVPFPSRYRDPLKFGPKWRFVLHYHDPRSGEALIRLAPDEAARELAREEADAEAARLLYVAVTRARHRCYLGVTPFAGHPRSPLGRVLESGDEDAALREAAQTLATAPSVQLIETDAGPPPPSASQDTATAPAPPRAATFYGHIEDDWWLASFSALSRDLRHGGLSPADRDQDDNGPVPPSAAQLRFVMPRGVDTGNLLHGLLEQIDFQAPDWDNALRGPLYRFGPLPQGFGAPDLAAWLEECLHAPLPHGARLAALQHSDTLRETGFYFPMDAARREQLAELLGAHRGEPAPLPGPERLKGMMQGYIDLIYRWRGRYYLTDYKSNHLGDSLGDYTTEALRRNLRDSYYDLQYLIYGLALHRHLRLRLDGYDPARDLGGVCYLYLRGMHPDSDSGVFHTPLSPALLDALDALFAGATP